MEFLSKTLTAVLVVAASTAHAQYSSYTSSYYTPAPTYDVGYGRTPMPESYSYPPYDYVATPLFGPYYDKTPYTPYVVAPIAAQITALLNASVSIEVGDVAVDTNTTKKLYKLRAFQPGFVVAEGPTMAAFNLLGFLKNKVALKGLSSADYAFADIDKRWALRDSRSLAELDILLSYAMIRVAGDMMNGRANPRSIDTHTLIDRKSFAEHEALNSLLRPDADIVAGLESFEPQHAEFKKLLKAYENLLAIRARGGWPVMKTGILLKPNASSPDVPLFRQRMVELGHLPEYELSNTSTMYDGSLFEAAQKFQTNHKLTADGKIGPRGFAVLNIPIETRLEQLRATLEKWRWLPRTLGERHIVINLAQQELRVIEYGRLMLAMRTVNGKLLRPTPVMVDALTQVTLNPYWFPPDSIIRNDILPKAKDNPNYMIQHKIKLFGPGGVEVDPLTVPWKNYRTSLPPYQFREEPGTQNSLGRVKFSLAKSDSTAIYMHDTNVPELFPNIERLNSSGCIRLEKPLDLLQYLFREVPSYDVSSVNTILAQPEIYPAQKVDLPRSLPVYIMYQTVSFDDEGALRFTRDYYGQDERIVRAMEPIDGTL
ncbi:MAG: L,D-transpeptidase family protein [Bdellovibrionota bacterium]